MEDARGPRLARELSGRPLFLLFLAVAIGIAASRTWPFVLAAVVLVAIGTSARARGVVALGVALGFLLSFRTPYEPVSEPKAFRGEVTLVGGPERGPYGQYALVVHEGLRYGMTFARDEKLVLSQKVRVVGELMPPREGQDEAWRRQRISGLLRAEGRIDPVRPPAGPFRYAERLRARFLERIERLLPPAEAAWLAALCVNERGGLDPEDWQALRESGTVHIVSASGLHVLLVVLVLSALTSPLPIPRWVRVVSVLGVAALFVAVTGSRAPAVRAWIMVAVLFLAPFVRRQADGPSALAVAGLVWLALFPDDLFELGFQLSYAAVLGISVFGGLEAPVPANALARLGFRVEQMARVSLAAFASTLPIQLWAFGGFSWIAVPANVLIGGMLPVLMGAAALASLVVGVADGLAQALVRLVILPLSGWLQLVARASEAWPRFWQPTPFLPDWLAFGATIGIFLLWRPRVRPA